MYSMSYIHTYTYMYLYIYILYIYVYILYIYIYIYTCIYRVGGGPTCFRSKEEEDIYTYV